MAARFRHSISDADVLAGLKDGPPGVRENGGQYTHAAAWVVLALALAESLVANRHLSIRKEEA